MVTKYHKKYLQQLQISQNIEAYVQSRVLNKTLETLSFEQRRSIEDGLDKEYILMCAVENLSNLAIQEVKMK